MELVDSRMREVDTFIPAATHPSSGSASSEAGPMVATSFMSRGVAVVRLRIINPDRDRAIVRDLSMAAALVRSIFRARTAPRLLHKIHSHIPLAAWQLARLCKFACAGTHGAHLP